MVPSPGTSKNISEHSDTQSTFQPMSVTTIDPPSIRYEDHEIPSDSAMPNTIFLDGQPSQRIEPGLYEELSKYTFGAATSSASSRLSLPHDSPDELPRPLSDTTPRPSVSIPGPNQNYPNLDYASSYSDDTASTHTFGVETGLPSRPSASASVSSLTSDGRGPDDDSALSNSSAPIQFSSDEYEEEDSMDEFAESDAPAQSAAYQPHGDGWGPLIEIPPSSSSGRYSQRRASLPALKPGVMPSSSTAIGADYDSAGRSREDSVVTVRRASRSLDNDMQVSNAVRSGAGHAIAPWTGPSESQRRVAQDSLAPVGTSTTNPVEIDSSAEDPALQDFDPDWLREMQEMQKGITGIEEEDVLTFANAHSLPQSGRRPSGQSWITGFGNFWRRQSSATIGTTEDVFERHVLRYDQYYSERRSEWSFKKELADVPKPLTAPNGSPHSPKGSLSQATDLASVPTRDSDRTIKPRTTYNGMPRGTEEFWRCEFVGRYRVNRKEVKSRAPQNDAKPPQQRLDIQPIADPYSKVFPHTHGTPVTIHKHSRAIAFSIYRQRRPHPSHRAEKEASKGAAPNRSSIMLAPKRVQEQYTSTRTTITLDTHGLLGGESARAEAERLKKLEKKVKEKKLKEARAKEKSKVKKDRSDNSTSSQSSTGSINGSVSAPSTSGLISQKPSSKDPLYLQTQSSTASVQSLPNQGSTPKIITRPTVPTYVPLARRPVSREMDSDDDVLGEKPKTRTTHSEAFSTMDGSFIVKKQDSLSRTEPSRPTDDASGTILKRLFGTLRPKPTPPPQAALEGVFNPPWCQMTSRTQQEERERVVQALNSSFEGVGLLPSKTHSKSKVQRKSANKNSARPDIFENIPPDSLYMLLPLWPGETDSHSVVGDPEASKPNIPPEQRQYLLVYYTPFQQTPARGGKSKKDSEKRSQTSSSASGIDDIPDEYSVLLSSLSCAARLVTYGDLHGSGVLAPNEGLYVTGPISEAMRYLPSPSIRDENEFIVAICQSRDQGVYFVPEGLVKMGLCYPPVKQSPAVPTLLPNEEDPIVDDTQLKLTPIGRAVVEMAWLGCIALMSFGPV